MKIRIVKVIMGATLAIALAFSTTALDQSLGQLLDILGQMIDAADMGDR